MNKDIKTSSKPTHSINASEHSRKSVKSVKQTHNDEYQHIMQLYEDIEQPD
jgi:hypothetical protein